jgi:hypothetical protein
MAFFLTLLVVGVLCHRDYGVTWDEFQQRATGAESLKYVVERIAPGLLPPSAKNLQPFDQYRDHDYGVAFELPAVVLEVLLGLHDEREIYFLRHLLNFLVAWAGAIALWRLALRRFGDWRPALLAAVFLVFSPRLFAESFYNSKDIVFMAAVAIGLNTAIGFVLAPGTGRALGHALATALAIDVRIMAVLLPLLTVAVLACRLLKREVEPAPALRGLAVYLAASAALVVAMWPFLWADPLGHFVEAFGNMARFRWDGVVLELGHRYPGTDLPWHYIPVWIAITTPLLYLALFLAGAGAILHRFAAAGTRLWRNDGDLQDLVFLGFLVVPIVAVIALHSVLYHGWRHLFFVYPAFLLIAVRGAWAIWQAAGRAGTERVWAERTRSVWRWGLAGVTAVTLLQTGVWMARAHPFENVYFNVLAGRNWKDRFDVDYFGMANRQALEYIAAHDRRPRITVGADSFTLVFAAIRTLPPQDRVRFGIGEPGQPGQRVDYLFDNFYRMPHEGPPRDPKAYEPFHEVRVDGELILSVFKKKWD